MMLEMVHDHAATGVTRVFRTPAVLQCGKQMEKLPLILSWIFSSTNREKCEIFPLVTKLSGGKLLRHLANGGGFLEQTPCGRCYSEDYKQKKQKEHHSIKIGTWNVMILNQGRKIANLKQIQKNAVSVKCNERVKVK
jgi:hypothetical protein